MNLGLLGEWRERIARESGSNMYTVLCLWITNKDLLYSTRSPAQCYVPAWMGGEFGGKSAHVYVRLSNFALHLNYHNIINQLYSNIK